MKILLNQLTALVQRWSRCGLAIEKRRRKEEEEEEGGVKKFRSD